MDFWKADTANAVAQEANKFKALVKEPLTPGRPVDHRKKHRKGLGGDKSGNENKTIN